MLTIIMVADEIVTVGLNNDYMKLTAHVADPLKKKITAFISWCEAGAAEL